MIKRIKIGTRHCRYAWITVSVLAMIAGFGLNIVQAAPTLVPEVPRSVADGTVRRLGTLPPDQQLEITLSLPLRDEAGLDRYIAEIYDRVNPNFRNYLSVAEFTGRFGPSAADYDNVRRFAAANRLAIRGSAPNRLIVDVSARVADIERAFHVEMGIYQHPTEARTFYAPDREPSPDLNVRLLHISGLDDLNRPRPHLIRGDAVPQSSSTGTGSGPHGNFLGSDIRAAYYGASTLTGAGQSVGLLEFGGYDPADIAKYFSKANQPLNVPIVAVSLNGTTAVCSKICADSEQALDVEEVISMAPGLKQVVFYAGDNAVSILNRMATDNSSRQLSSSWGWNADASVVDPIFKEFAAQGQSFVDATGDDGYQLAKGDVWPGDDQNVTGVGGTTLVTNGAGGTWLSETGWVYSGGGPSPDGISIPGYQLPFINAANQGSTTLRNVPDIAGAADNFYSCFEKICLTGNGGTSYAAPLWAGFIALTNQQAVAHGQAAIGFLNPVLYDLGAGSDYALEFHDQVSGNNGEYNAVAGFDLVTGFGSPQGETLINALITGSLPSVMPD